MLKFVRFWQIVPVYLQAFKMLPLCYVAPYPDQSGGVVSSSQSQHECIAGAKQMEFSEIREIHNSFFFPKKRNSQFFSLCDSQGH